MRRSQPRQGHAAVCAALLLSAPLLALPAAAEPSDGVPFAIAADYRDGERYMGIRLRGALRLRPRVVAGITPHGLSGLAWDADDQLLYAVSDLGYLVHLRPQLADGTLVGVNIVAVYPLRDAAGAALQTPDQDAEEICARKTRNGIGGDAELLIAFEHGPRIARYSPQGTYLGEIAPPAALARAADYADPNQQLEALALTRRFGLISGPERPLRGAPAGQLALYADQGRRWTFTPFDPDYSGLVGLATLPDDNLLILERRFISLAQPLVIVLRRMILPDVFAAPSVTTEVARLDTSRGWAIDNFEAVAWHQGAGYFLISDDNASALQTTVLLYIELLAADQRGPEADWRPPPLANHHL